MTRARAPDYFLFRISRQYYRERGFRRPNWDWFDRLIEHRPLRFNDAEEIARLRHVLIRITDNALTHRRGHMPNANDRLKILKQVEGVRTAYHKLWRSIDSLHYGFRPDFEVPPESRVIEDERLTAVELWIEGIERYSPRRGNRVDHWERSLLTTLLGFYNLAFQAEWRDCRGDAAKFFFAYTGEIKRLLESCTVLPLNERMTIIRRWQCWPSEKAVLERMEKIKRADIECTSPPSFWRVTSNGVHLSPSSEHRAISVAELFWIGAGEGNYTGQADQIAKE